MILQYYEYLFSKIQVDIKMRRMLVKQRVHKMEIQEK